MNPLQRLAASYWAPAPAKRLAMLRILIGGYTVLYLAFGIGGMVSVAKLATRQFKPVGPIAVLSEPLAYGLVVAIAVAAIAIGIAFVLGFRHRITGPLFALAALWVISYRNSWGMIFHTENLMVLHVIVVGLAPGAADAWSWDARGRDTPADGARYGWPIKLLCILTLTTYFLAGYAKLSVSGVHWATSDTLRGLVAYDNVRKIELGDMHSPIGAALVGQGWLFPPLAAVSLFLEVAAPLALLGRRIAKVWCVAAWSFHVGVLAVMAIMFHYPVLGVAYASFFAVERLGERVLAWRNRRRNKPES